MRRIEAADREADLHGMVDPTLEPSMLGKRPGCVFEVLALGLVPFAIAILLLRRRAPLERLWVGGLAGFGAAAIPAVDPYAALAAVTAGAAVAADGPADGAVDVLPG